MPEAPRLHPIEGLAFPKSGSLERSFTHFLCKTFSCATLISVLSPEMDGLSAAASVIAVLQIAQSIGSLLRDMYRNVRHARPQIENLYDSIISLEAIVKGLDGLVRRRGMGMINAALLEDAQGPLKRALCELQIVKKKLDIRAVGDSLFGKMKPSFKESVKRSFHWPFAKEEVLAIVEKLENYKSSLLMDVTINTL